MNIPDMPGTIDKFYNIGGSNIVQFPLYEFVGSLYFLLVPDINQWAVSMSVSSPPKNLISDHQKLFAEFTLQTLNFVWTSDSFNFSKFNLQSFAFSLIKTECHRKSCEVKVRRYNRFLLPRCSS
jgi:hypothetical protein